MKDFNFDLRVSASKIDGKGLFAFSKIPGRRKIGELGGEIIPVAKARKIAEQNKRIAIVEVDYKYALYSADLTDKFRYINHSCQPNAYMRVINHRVEFYTLREIKKNEEITCNYGETHHEGQLRCKCNVKGCIGYL